MSRYYRAAVVLLEGDSFLLYIYIYRSVEMKTLFLIRQAASGVQNLKFANYYFNASSVQNIK